MEITNETRLVYLIDDEPYAGTLADWAKAQENAQYNDVEWTVWIVERDDYGCFTIVGKDPEVVSQYDNFPDDVRQPWYGYTDVRLGDAEATIKVNLDV